MRLLLVPMYSSPQNIRTCSTFNHIRHFVKQIVENRDCMLYVVVPENASEPQLVDDTFKHPRIRILKVPASRNQHRELVYMPEQLIQRFSEMEGDLYIDAVLTDKPAMVGFLKTILHTWSENSLGYIPVGLFERFFVRPDQHSWSPDHYRRSQCYGLALADRVYWTVPHAAAAAFDLAKNYLPFADIKRLREKSMTAFGPVDFDELDPFLIQRDANNPQRIVNYAYGLTATYRVQDTFDMMDYLYARGNRDVRILVTTASKSFGVSDVPAHYKQYMDMNYALPQHEFWRKAAQAHAFIHMPSFCQISAAVMEQQYLGQIGVLPDKAWARDVVYKGYPFLGKGVAEMQGMLRYVLDNYFSPEIQAIIVKQRAFLRATYDPKILALKLYDDLKATVGTGLYGSRGTLCAVFAEMWKDKKIGDLITFDEWKTRTKKETRIHFDVEDMPLAMQGTSKNRFRRVMLEIGFEDVYDEDMPTFRRVSLFDPAAEPASKAGIVRSTAEPRPAVHGIPVLFP